MKKIFFSDRFKLTEVVLSGRKTQTRRVINLSLENLETGEKFTPERIFSQDGVWKFELDGKVYLLPRENLPKYKVGEVVAVAQSYASIVDELETPKNFCCMEHWESAAPKRAHYCSFLNHPGMTNKMFVSADEMPHQIRITNVRVERLQDISDEDCIKEGIIEWDATEYNSQEPISQPITEYHIICKETSKGIPHLVYNTPKGAFAELMHKLKRGIWEENPWVYVYDFELVK